MNIVLTDISAIIKKLLQEQHRSIFELANFLKMNPIDLKNKLFYNPEKPSINNFTLNQLEKIGIFFNCELIIEYKCNDTENIYQAKTLKEICIEDSEELGKYWESILRLYNDNQNE